MDAVGKTLVGLKLITGKAGNPQGGIALAPEKKLCTNDRDTPLELVPKNESVSMNSSYVL